MSYESFDGGSHSTHDWVPVGHERLAQWDASRAGPVGKDSFQCPERLADKTYVVRACSKCPEVWWQEYDATEAMA